MKEEFRLVLHNLQKCFGPIFFYIYKKQGRNELFSKPKQIHQVQTLRDKLAELFIFNSIQVRRRHFWTAYFNYLLWCTGCE